MTDLPDMAGRSVLVVGGSSGIGAATADLAARAGAQVTVIDRIPPANGDYISLDLRDRAAVGALGEDFDREFDLLVNSAGLPAGADPADILTVNYSAACALTGLLLSKARPGARVISIASIAGREWRDHGVLIDELDALAAGDLTNFVAEHGIGGSMAYRLSKAALIRWSRRQAARVADNSVTFLTISPGPIQTELFTRASSAAPQAVENLLAAAPRVPEPTDLAAFILDLCRPAFDWLNGINIPFDGGADARFDAMGLNMAIAPDKTRKVAR